MSRKISTLFAALIIAILALSACAGPQNNQTQKVEVVVVNAPAQDPAADSYANLPAPSGGAADALTVASPMPVVENAIPFAQATTCDSFPKGTTRDLLPGQTVAGDVYAMVKGEKVRFFKNDTGVYDLIRNTGSENVKIVTDEGWGAGCLVETDEKVLVNGEYENPNHTDLVAVHLVTFTSANAYTEKFYPKAELPLK